MHVNTNTRSVAILEAQKDDRPLFNYGRVLFIYAETLLTWPDTGCSLAQVFAQFYHKNCAFDSVICVQSRKYGFCFESRIHLNHSLHTQSCVWPISSWVRNLIYPIISLINCCIRVSFSVFLSHTYCWLLILQTFSLCSGPSFILIKLRNRTCSLYTFTLDLYPQINIH